MRKKFYLQLSLFRILVLFFGFSLITVCSCAGNRKKITFKPQTFTKSLIQPDDSVKSIFTDSICNIIFNPQSCARLYTINIGASVDNDTKHFGKFIVKDYLGVIKDNYLSSLTSMMADSTFYTESLYKISAPFLPDAVIEFSLKKQSVAILFCFNVKEFALLDKEGNIRYIPYGYNKLVSKFFNSMFEKSYPSKNQSSDNQ